MDSVMRQDASAAMHFAQMPSLIPSADGRRNKLRCFAVYDWSALRIAKFVNCIIAPAGEIALKCIETHKEERAGGESLSLAL